MMDEKWGTEKLKLSKVTYVSALGESAPGVQVLWIFVCGKDRHKKAGASANLVRRRCWQGLLVWRRRQGNQVKHHLGAGLKQWGRKEVLTHSSEMFLSFLSMQGLVSHALQHISLVFPLSGSEVGFERTMNQRPGLWARLLACVLTWTLCVPDTPREIGLGWPQTSHIPTQELLQIVDTNCLPSG